VPNVKEQQVSPIDWLGIFLTGFGLAGLIFGFENLGRGALPPLGRRRPVRGRPRLPRALLGPTRATTRTRSSTSRSSAFPPFQASVLGGAFFRLVPGATPFLLAMLLQVGFGMTAFAAGPDDLHLRRRRPGDEDHGARRSCAGSASARSCWSTA
jgi:hypothetical protein